MLKYGIWCESTDTWVGEYAPERNDRGEWDWIPATYPSKKAATEDLHEFTHSAKQRTEYDIRRYRGKVHGASRDAGGARRQAGSPGSRREDGRKVSADAQPGGAVMAYKVRSTKRGEGGGCYGLSYGKGDSKLAAVLHRANDGTWYIEGSAITGYQKKRDAMAKWAAWAEKIYTPMAHEVDTPPPKPSPPKLPKKGPPVFKPKAAPAPAVERPSHPDYDDKVNDVTDDGANPYLADFLGDKGLFERGDAGSWRLTPLGALDEVHSWMQQNLPFHSTLEFPWVRVTKVLQREFPADEKYQPEK